MARTCDVCGVALEDITPEAEAAARAEMEDVFGDVSLEDCSVTCTECYCQIVSWMMYGNNDTIH